MVEEEKGGSQEVRESNVNGGNDLGKENKFKSDIKCKKI